MKCQEKKLLKYLKQISEYYFWEISEGILNFWKWDMNSGVSIKLNDVLLYTLVGSVAGQTNPYNITYR